MQLHANKVIKFEQSAKCKLNSIQTQLSGHDYYMNLCSETLENEHLHYLYSYIIIVCTITVYACTIIIEILYQYFIDRISQLLLCSATIYNYNYRTVRDCS